MNGLVATVHGEPINMTAVATGILLLIALAVLSILIGLRLYLQTLTTPKAPLMASACFVLVGAAVVGCVFSRRRLGTVRDRVSAHLLPSEKAVTVLELTPAASAEQPNLTGAPLPAAH